jgi:hypothetical protein
MATLPISVTPRKGETVEQFNKRVQKARAEFIQQHRPTKQRPVPEHPQAARRRPGPPVQYRDSLVTALRAMWVAGLRIRDIARQFGISETACRNFCHEWSKRPNCIPALADIRTYTAYQRRLPDGPKLDARLQAWIAAVAAEARASRPEQA